MRLKAAAAMAATAAAAVALAAPPGAHGAEKAIWGPVSLPDGSSAFPLYRALGVDTYQIQLNFPTTAPTRPADPGNPADPAYRWPAHLDTVVSEAAANGVDVAILGNRSPGWANGGRSEIGAPHPSDYASFMAAASRRYPSVRRWMIWGEPNRDDRFQPNGEDSPVGPRAYAAILDASYGALKAVSPRNIVIGGMTWTGGTVKPARFLKLMRLPSGRPPRLDWFGHNPFPFRFPNLRELPISGGWRDISDLDTFQRQLRRTYPGRRPRFWLSEFNVQSDKASNVFLLFVSQAEQARWLRAAYGIADELESVAGLGWLALLDEPEHQGSANWGLLTASGAPKPAYGAFLRAPSERLRPTVRVAQRIRRARLARRGASVRVTPRATGRVRLELRSRRGRVITRSSRRAAAGKPVAIRIRSRLRRGHYRLVVRAPRGARVRRGLSVR